VTAPRDAITGLPLAPEELIPPAYQWMLEPGQGGGAAQPGVSPVRTIHPAAVVQPPDHFQPPGSQPLYAISPLTAIAGPATWAVPAAVRTQINAGSVARLASFSCLVLNLLATSLVTFQLRVNGLAIPGGTRLVPAAPLAVAFFPFDLYWVTPQNAVIDVVVSVADAGAYQVQAWYEGWVYAASVQLRYYQTLLGVLG
jgi:hypothetical protein